MAEAHRYEHTYTQNKEWELLTNSHIFHACNCIAPVGIDVTALQSPVHTACPTVSCLHNQP